MDEPMAMESLLKKMIDEQGSPHPRHVCEACAQAAGSDRASIAVIFGQVRHTVCATDPVAAHIDELQFSVGEGPCIEACRTGEPVIMPDFRDGRGEAARRWPMFTAALTEFTQRTGARVQAITGIPLRVRAPGSTGTFTFGAVNLHHSVPLVPDRDRIQRAQAAADAAALAVLGDLPDGPALDSSWWQAEAEPRTEVHQATGVIMSSLGLPADQALLRLRASAFAQSQTVRERAQEILAHRHLTESDL